MKKQTFGVIVTTRGFFPSHLVETAREKITKLLAEMGYGYVMVSETDTKYGAVLTYDEAKKCASLFKKHAEEISGIICILPNFGEETGVAEAIKLAGLDVPVLVQACDDDLDKLNMENRRDAFCGKISLCNNLYQRGILYTGTKLHTCNLNSPEFKNDIDDFAAVCRIVTGVRGSRIAMLGARPNAFNTVRFSEKILQMYDINVQSIDFSEVIAAAEAINDEAAVRAKVAEIEAYGRILEGTTDSDLTKQAKLCIALENFVEDLDCQASTVQCWDSAQKNYGCCTCLAMSMMGDKGKPSACESDVTGAVSMLSAYLAAGTAPALVDWNNNYGEDRDKCIAFHCSNYPKSFFGDTDVEIGIQDILEKTVGAENAFGTVQGRVAAGPMTYVRVTTDDETGMMKAYIGEGEFTDDKVDTKGGIAVCHIPNLQGLLKHICNNGYEHHVCFVRGNYADVLAEALGKYLGMEVYLHE